MRTSHAWPFLRTSSSDDRHAGDSLFDVLRLAKLGEAKGLGLAGDRRQQLAPQASDLPHFARRQAERYLQLHRRDFAAGRHLRLGIAVGNRQRTAALVNRPDVGHAMEQVDDLQPRLQAASNVNTSDSTVRLAEIAPGDNPHRLEAERATVACPSDAGDPLGVRRRDDANGSLLGVGISVNRASSSSQSRAGQNGVLSNRSVNGGSVTDCPNCRR